MVINESKADRLIRVVVGGGLIAGAFLALGVMDGELMGIFAGGAGVMLVLTGIVGFCPGYVPFKINTCAVK